MTMKRMRWVAPLALLLALFVAGGAMASSVAGEWSGSVSAKGLPFSLSVTFKFMDDGTFSGSMIGLQAAGTYSEEDGALTVRITQLSGLLASQLMPPDQIGAVRVPISLDGNTLTVSGDSFGIEGSVTLTRK